MVTKSFVRCITSPAPFRSYRVPQTSSIVPTSICASILCDCRDQPSCSLFFYATIPYFSTHRRVLSVVSTTSLTHLPNPSLSTYFLQSSEIKLADSFFVLVALAVLIQYPFRVLCSLLKQNKRIITCVSKPLMISSLTCFNVSFILAENSTRSALPI